MAVELEVTQASHQDTHSDESDTEGEEGGGEGLVENHHREDQVYQWGASLYCSVLQISRHCFFSYNLG